MTGFLSGAGLAALLAAVTFVAYGELSITSIERVENPALNLEGLDGEYSPLSESVGSDEVAD